MSLSAILDELRQLALKITPTLSDFSIKVSIDDDIAIKLTTRGGIEIDLEDVSIDPTGVWVYKGHHVLLFIPDQGWDFNDVMSGIKEGKKFHLTDCQTIDDMKRKDRFARYQATNNTEGIFAIHGKDRLNSQSKSGEVRLHVCKNCLTKLNYKDYNKARYKTKQEIYQNFNLDEFFKHYQTSFAKEPPNVGQDKAGYPANWDMISANHRQKRNWTCEQCHVNLSEHHHLLDTHHIDGVRHHTAEHNLKALCKTCHKAQSQHGHYYVSYDDQLKLDTLRKIQKLP